MTTTTMRHPIELLEDFEENYTVPMKITAKTSKRELSNVKKAFNRKNDRMKIIWDRSIKIHEIKEPELTTFKNEFKAVRKDLCIQLLADDFRKSYSDEHTFCGRGDLCQLHDTA